MRDAGPDPGMAGPAPDDVPDDLPMPPRPPDAPERQTPERPLASMTIVITRSEDRSGTLERLLAERGAQVIPVPTIRFDGPADPHPLEEALGRLGSFRWVLFTSATGVHFLLEAARRLGLPPEAFRGLRCGAVGPATAAALASAGFRTERIAAAATARSLAKALVGPQAREPLGPGDPCLLPQADIARPDLEEELRAAGVPVTAVTAYRTLAEDPEKARPFLQALEGDERIDGIAFASPSALRSFLAMTRPYGEEAIKEKPICVFSIGPTTSAAIRERGLSVAREASPHTIEALVEAIVKELAPHIWDELAPPKEED
jgi:uroporphyrinogen-III synthase